MILTDDLQQSRLKAPWALDLTARQVLREWGDLCSLASTSGCPAIYQGYVDSSRHDLCGQGVCHYDQAG